MKTMKKLFSMAALALVGAMTVSCSSDDNIIDQPQQPEVIKNNVVTLTTTVGFDEGAGTTRALDINYTAKTLTKTFAVGEQIALLYNQTGGATAKAVSAALTAGDISADGKSANFTFELTDPDKTQDVTYIYPAVMAGSSSADWSKLDTQDGTLASIASKLDYASADAAWNGDALPAVTLDNMLAIIAYTLKDEAGANDITSTITGMTISQGARTYTITGKDTDGHIYAAIQPTSGSNIEYTATDGTKKYTKSVTSKTYAKGEFYQQGLRMHEVTLADVFTEGAEVNVKVNSASGYWFNAAGTYSSGSYTGVTQTNNVGFGDFNKGISMTKDGNNLVVWMNNSYNEITITFNTTNNTYTVTAGEHASPYRMTTFNSITINGVDITSLLSEYVPPMETITFSSGSGTLDPVTNKTLFTGTHFNVAGSDYDNPSAYFTVNKFDNNMEISATDGKTITKVVFNYNWKANLGSLAFTSGTFDGNATVNNVNASTLTVTSSHAAGTKFSGVTIYYE